MFISINVPTCQAEIRNLMYKCMCRPDQVESSIIHAFINPRKSSIFIQYFCDMIPLLQESVGAFSKRVMLTCSILCMCTFFFFDSMSPVLYVIAVKCCF